MQNTTPIFRKLDTQNTSPVFLPEWAKYVDWAFERREEARLDAMYDARFETEED